jgi:hypothetical protein
MGASSPEVASWLAKAERIEWGGSGPGALIESDFNYAHDAVSGDGWALVGDAAGFVDPLFSIGVFLSQTGAQLLAYTLGTALSGEGGVPSDRLFAAYDHHLRGYLGAFRSMAYVFYGFNTPKEEWWRRTRELIRAEALPTDIDDRDAFIALTFGFGVNVTLFQEAIACFGQMAAPRIRDALMGHRADRQLELPPDARPRLARGYECVPSVVPAEGTGRVVPMTRIELAPKPGGPPNAAFPRHVYVPDALVPLIGRFDGTRSVNTLLAEAQAMLDPRADSNRGPRVDGATMGRHIVRALHGFGALEL